MRTSKADDAKTFPQAPRAVHFTFDYYDEDESHSNELP